MKALSLWQPWASLIACGAKRVETRGWPTSHRGLLAVHAAKRWTSEEREAADDLGSLLQPPERDLFWSHAKPPLGAFVAVATLVDCRMMTNAEIDAQTELERELGAWSNGRWAWFLADVRPLPTPIPARGRQGLWDVPRWEWEAMPADVLERRSPVEVALAAVPPPPEPEAVDGQATFWDHRG